MAIGAFQLARHVPLSEVNRVIELQRIRIFGDVTNLSKLRMIDRKCRNHIGVAACWSRTRGHGTDFPGSSLCLVSQDSRLMHPFCRSMARDAICLAHCWHSTAVFLVTFMTCEMRGHIRLVKILAFVTGEALAIHDCRRDGAALENRSGSQPLVGRTPGLKMPRISLPCSSVMACGAGANISRLAVVNAGKMLACVNA